MRTPPRKRNLSWRLLSMLVIAGIGLACGVAGVLLSGKGKGAAAEESLASQAAAAAA